MKSRLETILDYGTKYEHSFDAIEALQGYLEGNTENLTLDQYKSVRSWINQHYKKFMQDNQRFGFLSDKNKEWVNRNLTDYLRDQHYALLEQEKHIPIPNVTIPEETPGLFGRIKNKVKEKIANVTYRTNWRQKDNEMYALERLVFGFEQDHNPILEKTLIDSLPTKGYSAHKLTTLRRLIPYVHYTQKLENMTEEYLKNPKLVLQQ